ncbi:MAG: hypothetical protein FD153_23 [Rhodospirillaceae bacterium]|nr:MAG: hypothetical protein FD153_23 [Rhodospirillaceae bacterium]
MTVAFDTLKLARKLEAAGFEYKQAADIAEALAEAMVTADLVTKEHLDFRIDAVRADLRESEQRQIAAMQAIELRLTLRLGGMIAVGIAILAAMKFFGH